MTVNPDIAARVSRPAGAGAGARRRALAGGLVVVAITFLGLLAVTFFIGRIVPIDPVLAVVGDRASQETYDAVRAQMGLDESLIVQFATYVGSVLRGDLGMSITTGRPVAEDLWRVFPATFELATAGIIVGVVLGLPMGVWAAVHQGNWIDHTIRVLGLIGYAVPAFWLALVALAVFYAGLGWAAPPGRISVFYEGMVDVRTGVLVLDAMLAGEWDVATDTAHRMVLPVLILGFYSLAYISRMTRSLMLDQLGQEYLTTARVKGVSEARVIWVHAFRPILVPVVTVIGLSYASLLEGSVLIETVFSWPGLGSYLTNALLSADMAAVLGATLLIGAIFVVINRLSDLLYGVLDARSR
jgi:peptide/nickel transport system permease protein